jgi:hypothetical protein
VVLGQPDFSSDVADNGGVSASSLYWPSQFSSDGTRLAIADSLNNRVLVWDEFPTSNGQPATSVIGQGDFTSNTMLAGALPIYQTWGVSLAGAGMWLTSNFGAGLSHVARATDTNPAADFSPTAHLASAVPGANYTPVGLALLANGSMGVRDYALLRVGMFRSIPTKSPTPYDYVLGQPDLFRQVVGPVDGSSFGTQPYTLGSGGSYVLAPDANRVLVFDAPTYNDEPASSVIGQAGFGVNAPADYRAIGAATLGAPASVAVSGATVAIADRGNNRVVLYDKGALSTKPSSAKVILGQPDARSFIANHDLATPSASRLSGPAGVALDATHLIVADTENHRVLIWSPVPTITGAPADVVLGQADFAARRPNHGRADSGADGSLNADARGMFYPTGVATDGTHLVVADRLNHRVLVWNAIPTANGKEADAVLGQSELTANHPNRGAGPGALRADGFDLPSDVAISGTTLFVADTENNRVVRIADAFTSPTPDAWIGQPDGATLTNPNWGIGGGNPGLARQNATTTASVLRPRGIAVTSSALYVTERDSNRVHVLDPSTFAPLAVLGQPDTTSAVANAGGIGGASLSGPLGLATDGATLFVADANNHRVLGWNAGSPPSTGAASALVIGQPSELSNGFNQSSSASAGATSKPRGLARAGANLYVADTAHHRVLVFGAPPSAGDAPKRVFGQPDANLALPNAGGAPSARSLRSPRGVFADARRVIVADAGNHRVMVYDPTQPSPDAVLVLGQTSFTTSLPNAGGPATLGSLASPEGVYFDGTRLYVADTGNHRVLVWSSMPTQSGQPASFVLGQSAGDQVLSNGGGSTAWAASMASPTAVDVIGGALFVADAGNNRVLRWGALPTISGAPATSVLGQSDLTERTSASSAADTKHLAGPVALAHDRANLYVADRDAGRIVVFALPAATASTPVATVLGALGGLSVSGPGGLAVESTPFFTSRLYVADTNNDRVVVVGAVSRLIE